MAEPISPLNAPLSASTPDFDKFFAIPAIWTPDMNDGEWQDELDRMLLRSRLTHEFVSGNLSPNDFMDGLNDLNIDVYTVEDYWANGVSLLT